MAVLFDNSADGLLRDSDLPASTAFTVCGWAQRTSSPGAVQHALAQINPAGASDWMLIGFASADGTTLRTARNGSIVNFASSPTLDQWFFWAMSNQGTGATDFKGYWWSLTASTAVTVTQLGLDFTVGQLWAGTEDTGAFLRGNLANIKVWDAVLTEAELLSEKWTYIPRRFANLHIWSPLWNAASADDYSVGNRDWTIGGVLTNALGPPIPSSLRRRRGVLQEAPPFVPPNFGMARLGEWDVELHPRAWF